MNKTMMTLMSALVSATIVTAQPAPPAKHPKNQPVPADIFTEADTDGNGELSLGEFTVLVEKRRKQRQEAMDTRREAKQPPVVKEFLKEPVISE